MQYKELKKKISNSNKARSNAGLFVSRGKNKEKNGRGRNKSRVFTIKKQGILGKVAHSGKRDTKK
jgi:hypothetical protein